jgi:hypothetical protein
LEGAQGGTSGAGARRARRAGRLLLEGGGRRGRGAGGKEGEGRRREVPAVGEEADRLGAGGSRGEEPPGGCAG